MDFLLRKLSKKMMRIGQILISRFMSRPPWRESLAVRPRAVTYCNP